MNTTLTLATAAFALALAGGAHAQTLGGGLGGQLGATGGLGGATGSLGGAGSVAGGFDGSRVTRPTERALTRTQRRAEAARARAAAVAERSGRRVGDAATGPSATSLDRRASTEIGADGAVRTDGEVDASVSVGASATGPRRPNR